jgi:hypothetical protein
MKLPCPKRCGEARKLIVLDRLAALSMQRAERSVAARSVRCP